MIVEAYRVTLSASREYEKRSVETESLRVWRDRPALPAAAGAGTALPGAPEPADTVSVSEAPPCDAKTQALIYLVEKIVETFTGRKIRIRPFQPGREACPGHENPPPAALRDAGGGQGRGGAGWGVLYEATTTVQERETVDFRAGGVVRTTDGRELKFDLTLALSREWYEETAVRLRLGDAQAVDPLVISFDGNAAQLTNAKFAFDLDADGTQENISFLAPGSGFLVLDAGDTGRVADGSQLFGPSTGNGFAELSALDSDGNGWIDENDPSFADLRIWTKDASGADALSTLRDDNVGAIFLGNAETSFDITDAGNRKQGELARLGFWLAEDGSGPGLVSQVDLSV